MPREFVIPPHVSDPTRIMHEIAEKSNHPITVLRTSPRIKAGSTERRIIADPDVTRLANAIIQNRPFDELSTFPAIPKGQVGRDRVRSHNIDPGRKVTTSQGDIDLSVTLKPVGSNGTTTFLDVDHKAKSLPTKIALGVFGTTNIQPAAIDRWRTYVTIGHKPGHSIDRGISLGH